MPVWGIMFVVAAYFAGCAASAFLLGYLDAKFRRADPPWLNVYLALIWPAFWLVVALYALLLGFEHCWKRR